MKDGFDPSKLQNWRVIKWRIVKVGSIAVILSAILIILIFAAKGEFEILKLNETTKDTSKTIANQVSINSNNYDEHQLHSNNWVAFMVPFSTVMFGGVAYGAFTVAKTACSPSTSAGAGLCAIWCGITALGGGLSIGSVAYGVSNIWKT